MPDLSPLAGVPLGTVEASSMRSRCSTSGCEWGEGLRPAGRTLRVTLTPLAGVRPHVAGPLATSPGEKEGFAESGSPATYLR